MNSTQETQSAPDAQNAQGTLRADVLVIGFGKGGKTAAAALGRMGGPVVLVEQSERMYGGR